MDAVATDLHYEWLEQGNPSSLLDPATIIELPSTDCKALEHPNVEVRRAAARMLVTCLKEYGFAVLTNHSFSKEEQSRVVEQSKRFFALSDASKLRCAAKPDPSAALRGNGLPSPSSVPAESGPSVFSKVFRRSPSPTRVADEKTSTKTSPTIKKKDVAGSASPAKPPSPTPSVKASLSGPPPEFNRPMMKTIRGYGEFEREGLNPRMGPDLKETFDYGLAIDQQGKTHLGRNLWPTELPDMEAVAMAYLRKGLAQGISVLQAIALGLGLNEHVFDDHFVRPLTIQRLLKYPPQHNAGPNSKSIGAGSHVDFGALTLLYQTKPGLEIQLRTGEWRIVSAPPNALILNTGFLLEKLTNGVLPATQHRVVNRTDTLRYSTALFLDPHPESKIMPILDNKDSVTKKEYTTCTAGHKGVRYYGSGYEKKASNQ